MTDSPTTDSGSRSTSSPGQRGGRRHVVDSVAGLPPGAHRVLEVSGRSIGVFNDGGRIYAIRNVCPHHGAPLCAGTVSGRMLPSAPHVYDYSADASERVLRCPWHGYEFRLESGRSITDPERMRVKTYRVEVEGDDVVLYM
jgi:nitrite reductase/ring-hydroxylating ferredoxin subunit